MDEAARHVESLNWARFERLVVLSPHLDDAVLSCGALLHWLRAALPRLVVTACAGDPPQPSLTARGGAGSDSAPAQSEPKLTPPAERRREDAQAMQQLGCSFVHLGLSDAFDRRPARESLRQRMAALWEPPAAAERLHRDALESCLNLMLEGTGPTLLLAPLAIGGHVDHRLCATIALAMAERGQRVLFYEDVPYVAAPERFGGFPADDARSAAARLGRSLMEPLYCPVEIDTKMQWVNHYASQVQMLFGNAEQARETIGQRRLRGIQAEVFWQVAKH